MSEIAGCLLNFFGTLRTSQPCYKHSPAKGGWAPRSMSSCLPNFSSQRRLQQLWGARWALGHPQGDKVLWCSATAAWASAASRPGSGHPWDVPVPSHQVRAPRALLAFSWDVLRPFPLFHSITKAGKAPPRPPGLNTPLPPLSPEPRTEPRP